MLRGAQKLDALDFRKGEQFFDANGGLRLGGSTGLGEFCHVGDSPARRVARNRWWHQYRRMAR